MLNKTDGSTLPLAGEVCAQFIRCGKTGCHCNNGEPHGPYYYRIWREGNFVRKMYVKSQDLEAVRAACEVHKALHGTLRDIKHTREKLTHSIQKEWRRTQRLLKK